MKTTWLLIPKLESWGVFLGVGRVGGIHGEMPHLAHIALDSRVNHNLSTNNQKDDGVGDSFLMV